MPLCVHGHVQGLTTCSFARVYQSKNPVLNHDYHWAGQTGDSLLRTTEHDGHGHHVLIYYKSSPPTGPPSIPTYVPITKDNYELLHD